MNENMKPLTEIGAFLLFPLYATGYILGFLFETIRFGFERGRKGVD